jgi:hypothetical protein
MAERGSVVKRKNLPPVTVGYEGEPWGLHDNLDNLPCSHISPADPGSKRLGLISDLPYFATLSLTMKPISRFLGSENA